MAVIDDKVVAMSFESGKFESGINSTISALEKLKTALHFTGTSKGLDEVANSAKKIDLSHIGRGVEEVHAKLSALNVAAIAVFTNIALKAVAAGTQMVKSLALEPIMDGYNEYKIKLNAIQTILSNTQAAGTNLQDVTKALNELNKYSDKTIYNFGEMAKNIGTFTAAGVDLKTSVAAIKGISNLAALSGSNATQASTAMYQLSQALSAGKIDMRDWISVRNAGMGGAVFQRALAQTAVNMGTLKGELVKLSGPMKTVQIAGQGFAQSLSAKDTKGWLTSGVLTTTLGQLTGDLTDAQLAAQGFNDAQIHSIQATAKAAMLAATQVKDLGTVFSVAKETAGSGWAQTFEIIFGGYHEAKKTFTTLSNAVNDFINKSAEARNKVLQDWKDLGGRTALIDAIGTAFHNLGMILKPIKDAFRDIFPAKTGSDLMYMTQQFERFVDALKPGPETIHNLHRTFAGLFAVLDIGKQIIGGILTVFSSMFSAVHGGNSGFLDFTGSIGDFLVSIDKALKRGNGLHDFFAKLGTVLAAPIKLIGMLASGLGHLFSGFSTGGISAQVTGLSHAMDPVIKVMDLFASAWGKVMGGFGGSNALKPLIDGVVQMLNGLGIAIGKAASSLNFDAVLQVIKVGLLTAITLMIKQFLGKGSFSDQLVKGFSGVGSGLVGKISGTFGALQGSMVAMQQNIKAKTLKEIAIAIALLTVSVVALSFIDSKKLLSSLTAMAAAFGELLGGMAVLVLVTKSAGFVKLPLITASLILLAAAIDLLTIAVLVLSLLSWEQLAKGLGGVAALLIAISAAAGPLSANSAGMIRAGVGISALAIGLDLLAIAVRIFATMSLGEIAKGLGGIAAGLVIIAGAMQLLPKSMIITGAGLIAVAIGLNILAFAVEKFGKMDLKTMGKGLAGIAGGLIIIAGAMHLMPLSLPITAAGLILVSIALQGIARAIMKMGGMTIEQIAKGLGSLAGALAILAGALYLMSGTMAGAFALTTAASGLALLVPAIIALGKQSWSRILKGMVTLAAALTILGVAGLTLAPVVPALLGLGVALVLIGGGLALAGAGIFLLATGLSALILAAPTGVGILIAALNELITAVPRMAQEFVLGLLEIANMLGEMAPKFAEAILKLIAVTVAIIIEAAPKIAEAFTALISAGLNVFDANKGRLIQAGFDFITSLLQGIKNNISQITKSAIDIVVNFLGTLASNMSRIVTAGANVLVSFIKGIATNISRVAAAGLSIITQFLSTIGTNLALIVTAGISIVTKLIVGISQSLNKVVKAGADAIVSFIEGVGNAGPRIITAATDAIIKFINALSTNGVKLANAGMLAVISFLNGVALAIETHSGEMRAAGLRVGIAIIDGMTGGLVSKAEALYNTVSGIMHHAMGLIHKIPGVKSPSTVTYAVGEYIALGLANGISAAAPKAYSAAIGMSNGVIGAFNTTFQTASPSKVMAEIGKFVGQGFAQGLRGSKDDIVGAFTELNDQLTKAMTTAKETIVTEQAKLDELRKASKPDAAAIAAAQKVILENQSILAKSTAAHNVLVGTLTKEKTELIGLAKEYENLSARLTAAQDDLAAKTKERNDAVTSFSNQYSTLPDLVTTDSEGNPVDQLGVYLGALTNQANAVAAYQSTLEQLRALKLDKTTYNKLLTEGTADQAFADQLLAGGKTAVMGLNALDAQLAKVSKTLAVNAANNLFQAGVDSAQGVVNGLKSRKGAIYDQMEEIGRGMVAALRREIKSHSPSEAFAEIGSDAMAGLANGFTKASKIVTTAVEDAANNALAAMKNSMRNLSNIVTGELNLNPVITPILDLTQVQNESAKLASLTNVTPITAAASYGQASIISSQQTAAQAEEMAKTTAGGTSVKFEQNNYSPEALSEIEIYRQTRNQLSQLKSVLAIT